jgi:branched-chain amino acid transport system substrate-binding protein
MTGWGTGGKPPITAPTMPRRTPSWFFLTADYTFGYALERDTTAVVEANGGKVLGKVRHPLGSSDFSSFLLQAQASRAKVIGLANAGGDAVNAIKQAAEFGIVKGRQKLAGLLVWVSDVAALGLPTAQGLVLTDAWYWDTNDDSRTWTKRWQADQPVRFPTAAHAGVYSAVLHYLKAVVVKIRCRRSCSSCQNEGNADGRSSAWYRNRPCRRPQNT